MAIKIDIKVKSEDQIMEDRRAEFEKLSKQFEDYLSSGIAINPYSTNFIGTSLKQYTTTTTYTTTYYNPGNITYIYTSEINGKTYDTSEDSI